MTAAKEVARGADVSLVLAQQSQTRDALVDPRPGDIIPDNDEKGYHVGTVRQPAEPVLTADGAVHFESVDGGASKFDTTYADDFKKLDDAQQGDPLYAGTLHVPIASTPEETKAAEARARAARATAKK